MNPTTTKTPGNSPLDTLVGDWDGALSQAAHAETFAVAGKRVRITSIDGSLRERIQRSLAHLRDGELGPVSLQVILSQGSLLRADPFSMFGKMADSGHPVIVRGSGWQSRFDPREGILSVLDRTSRRALFWIADESRLPYWEEHAPLRHIFNWWFESEGFRIVHAAGIGTSSGGVLVVGGAGAGKSTVALSCLGSDLHCSGDDYQLVQTNDYPHTFSLYSCVKLERDNIPRFPQLAGLAEIVDEKARFFLAEICPDELIRDFPIRAVIVARVTEGESRLVPISAGRALAALAPSSILQLHSVHGDALAAMAKVVSGVGTFRLELGRDIGNVPSLVQEALG